MKNLLIVKLSDEYKKVPNVAQIEEIKERAKGAWKRKLETTKDLEYMVVLHEQKIIAVFKINGARQVIEHTQHRIIFDLDANTNQSFVGKKLDYPTSNVASDLDINTFVSRLK